MNSQDRIFDRTANVGAFSLRALRVFAGAIGALLALFMLVLLFVSGVGFGNKTLLETLGTEEITLNQMEETPDLEFANASSDTNGVFQVNQNINPSGLITTSTNGQDYTYTAAAGDSLMRTYYWSGAASTNNVEAKAGQCRVYTSGTVRQGTTTCMGAVLIGFGGHALELRRAGKLCVKQITVTCKSDNGYDGKLRWGYRWFTQTEFNKALDNYNKKKDLPIPQGSNVTTGTTVGEKSTDGAGQGWTGDSTTLNDTSSTNLYLMIWGSHYCEYGTFIGGRRPGFELYDMHVIYYSTDSTGPNISLDGTNMDMAWRQSKVVRTLSEDGESGDDLYSQSATFTMANGTTGTKATGDSANQYTYGSDANGVVSSLKVTYTNYSNRSTTKTFTLDDLKIDRGKPKVSSSKFTTSTTNSGAGGITAPTKSRVYLWVQCFDTIDDGNSAGGSGIAAISAYNEQTKETYTGESKGSNWYVFGTDKQLTNGNYTITATDGVGWQNEAYSTGMFGWYDGLAPTMTVTLLKTPKAASYNPTTLSAYSSTEIAKYMDSENINSWKYSNNFIYAKLEISDKADTVTGAYANATYISCRKPSSMTYSVSIGKDSSITYFNADSTYGQDPAYNSSNGTTTAVYYIKLPVKETYTFKVADPAGNETNVFTLGNNSESKTSLFVNIDTSAPRITKVTATANSKNAMTEWVHGEISLHIDLSDEMPSAITSIMKANAGSGLSMLEIFAYDHNGYEVTAYSRKSDNGTEINLRGNRWTKALDLTLTADYNEVAYYEFVVTDVAGNTSSLTKANFSFQVGGSSVSYTYYINDMVDAETNNKEITVFKDSNPVIIKIFDAEMPVAYRTAYYENVVFDYMTENEKTAARNSIRAQVVQREAWENAHKLAFESETYTMPWSKAAATTFWVQYIFGPSGAVLTSSTGSFEDAGLNKSDSSNSILSLNTSYNRTVNTTFVQMSYSAVGVCGYQYTATNGAGVATDSGILQTRMDRAEPKSTVIGFGSEGGFISGSPSFSNISEVSSQIRGFVSESALTGSDWVSENNVKYAFIAVSDEDSGTDKGYQTYANDDRRGSTPPTGRTDNKFGYQWTEAYATLYFSHNGYSYNIKDQGSNELNYVKCGSLYILIIRLWDLDEIEAKAPGFRADYGQGVPFEYKIEVRDFVGNSAYVKCGGSDTLQYKVDPYTPDGKVVNIWREEQISETETRRYDYDSTRLNGEWTRDSIVFKIEKTQMCLAPTYVAYKTFNIVDKPSENKYADGWTENPDKGGTWTYPDIAGAEQTVEIKLAATTSRSQQIFFKFYSGSYDAVTQTYTQEAYKIKYFPAGSDEGDVMCVRQDIDKPILKYVYFSTSDDLKQPYNSNGNLDPSILLFYAAEATDSGYDLVRCHPDYDSDLANIWTHRATYMYMVVTDYNGTGLGSGMNEVKVTTGEESASTIAFTMINEELSGDYLVTYRGGQDYGYTNKTDRYGFTFSMSDNQSNVRTATVAYDDAGRKIFPVIDSVIPYIQISTAKVGETSYLTADGKQLNGGDTAIQSSINITFRYEVGMSDAQLYFIKLPYDSVASYPDSNYEDNSDRATSDYKFIGDLSKWEEITGGKASSGATPEGGALWNYTIEAAANTTIKNKYFIMIVNGAGVYYYFDAGKVFIDTAPPVIDPDKIFFARYTNEHSSDTNPSYSQLYILDEDKYTDDDVYLYFQVVDAGSGVKEVCYPQGSERIQLEVVDIIEKGTYYRLLATDKKAYTIEAVDNAGNKTSVTKTPLIDKKEVEITVTAKTKSDLNYVSGTFIKEESVSLTYTVIYGASGFGGVTLNKSGDKNNNADAGIKKADIAAIDNLTDNTKWTIGSDKATITVEVKGEMNYFFSVIAYNTIAAADSKAARPSADNTFNVAIDLTEPSINTNDAGSNYKALTEQWFSTGQVLKVKAIDSNAFGSGVSTVKINYKVNGNSGRQVTMSNVGGYFVSDVNPDDGMEDKPFKLEHYVTYTITVTDLAGNSKDYELLPKIDMCAPTLALPTLKKASTIDGNDAALDYTAGEWINANVTINLNGTYSISGAKLQYYDHTAQKWADWESGDSSYGVYSWLNLAAGDSGTKTLDPALVRVAVPYNSSKEYRYILRLISGSGLVSSEYDLGYIRIDKVKPIIGVNVRINGNSTDFGQVGENITTLQNWTNGYMFVNVSTASKLVSGYDIYYNLSQLPADANNFQSVGFGYVNNSTFNLDYSGQRLVHTISDTVNDETYRYYIKSKSGMMSDIYTVSGVKIDLNTPGFSVGGELSMNTGTPQSGKFNLASESDYTGNVDLIYNLKQPVWTNKNAVIIKIDIAKITYSGLRLVINDVEYESFSYDAVNLGNNINISRYYAIDRTAEINIRLITGAGSSKAEICNVKIDNDVPILFVSSIEGIKSINWDGNENTENSWYTSLTQIFFTVGTLVKDGSGYRYNTTVDNSGHVVPVEPTSGYELEYTTVADPQESDWLSMSKILTLPGENSISNAAYRFRIRSKSGMSFELGKAAHNNNGEVAMTVANVKNLISSNSGLLNHLSDSDFVYNIKVDINAYTITINQLIEFYTGVSFVNIEGGDFANYVIYKHNGTQYELLATEDQYVFRHGDLIKVEYSTNDYIHRYTDYGGYEYDKYGNLLYADGEPKLSYATFGKDISTDELTGEFTYRFGIGSLTVNTYFMKELNVAYSDTVMYMQDGIAGGAKVNAVATYNYIDKNGIPGTVDIPLALTYTDINGAVVTGELDIGGYIVNVAVKSLFDEDFTTDVNAINFRLLNPSTVLLVKYFKEKVVGGVEIPNSATNPYTIKTVEDMNFISKPFSSGFTVNGDSYSLIGASYLDSHYILDKDLDLTGFGGIKGNFRGSFNGNEKTLTLEGGHKSGAYGLFEQLSGSVKNLILKLDGTLGLDNVTDAGLLAAVISGGQVGSMRIDGEININSAVLGANIGGLAGRIENATIGGTNDNIYADIVIYNNGNAITKANIGGLVGYVGDGSYVTNTYTYSHLTVYNVTGDVKVGAVFGNAETTDYTIDVLYSKYFNNKYLAGNTFVNDALAPGFIGVGNTINNANETYNSVKGYTYAAFIAMSGLGTTNILGTLVRKLVLDKLYFDFGMSEESGEYSYGEGTAQDPLTIGTIKQMRMIDKYMNLSFRLAQSGEVELGGFGAAIGLHKVFAGEFDGTDHIIKGFGVGFDVADGNRIGLFAEVSGKVVNIVFKDVAVYDDSGDVTYAGVVAGKLNGGTVGNIIAIGSMNLTADGAVYAAAIAGYAKDGTVYDIFSIVNVKIVSTIAKAGGILGYSDGTRVGSYRNADNQDIDGPVFALGRVEAQASSSAVGAIAADGTFDINSGVIYGIDNNVYSNGRLVTKTISGQVRTVAFDNAEMRNTMFSDGTAIFSRVFGGLYYLTGSGTSTDKFIVRTEQDFGYIDHMLYASYNIVNSNGIEFTNFRTIGVGLVFSGSIDGKTAESWSAEDGTVSSLKNVTDALVYNNAGSISDLGINIYYSKTIDGTDLTFGAVAVYNTTGTIRNVTVSGKVNVTSVNKNSTVIISGFVGEASGGVIEGDSKVQNSISGLDITVTNAGMVYAGGYIGRVDGIMSLSYGIGNGTLNLVNCGKNSYAGTLVGAAYADCNWASIEETQDYRYKVTVNGTETTQLFGYQK